MFDGNNSNDFKLENQQGGYESVSETREGLI